MNYLVHATSVHPSLCLQYLILLFTIDTIIVFTLLLLLLFHYCHYYKTVATDKPLRASLFLGAAELTTHLSRLINILWLPLCRINKFGFYFPRRLLWSPILVGHQYATLWALQLSIVHWAACGGSACLWCLHRQVVCPCRLAWQRWLPPGCSGPHTHRAYLWRWASAGASCTRAAACGVSIWRPQQHRSSWSQWSPSTHLPALRYNWTPCILVSQALQPWVPRYQQWRS
jgi:hypothetical protein